MSNKKKSQWFVYILRCSNNCYYTGITNNLEKRVKKHNSGQGAHYTKIHRPVKLVYYETSPNRSNAMKREYEIKSWQRNKKINLIQTGRELKHETKKTGCGKKQENSQQR